ncbi:MAG: hypothetical protein MUP85_20230 [Candidatus Lokiarchaeota archaeon]|nr:hypothetical protein [Candidatus Lokiarchaeota archaeon]
MYMKIWGLEILKKFRFPYPPYQIISINEEKPLDIEKYVIEKIKLINVPNIPNDRIGVTIRVSLPGSLDKKGKHGGLHVIDEKEILKRVLQKHEQYKPLEKIILQHTVDAKYSGVTMRDNERIIIEVIPGDAPPLLQGETNNFESWTYDLNKNEWSINRSYLNKNEDVQILNDTERDSLVNSIKRLNKNVYLEWSMSKKGEIFYYEYLEFPDV